MRKLETTSEFDDDQIQEASTPTGLIRVRARRGQATDYHSLAERVRTAQFKKHINFADHQNSKVISHYNSNLLSLLFATFFFFANGFRQEERKSV